MAWFRRSRVSKIVRAVSESGPAVARRPRTVLRVDRLEDRSLLSGNLIAYTFHGANTSYYAPPGGAIGGGYYIIDPTRTADLNGQTARWDLTGLGGAIDNSLADEIGPSFIRGNHVEAYNNNSTQEGGAYVRYGPIGSYDNITLYTKTGSLATDGQTLGSYLGSHPIDWLGGGVPFTYVKSPAISSFAIDDVFRNKKSLETFVAKGTTMTAKFTPTIQIGGMESRIRLEDAALLFGVDHFNWVQKVIEPAAWQVSIEVDGISVPAPRPFYDPITLPTGRYVVTNESGIESNVTTPFKPDDLPFYFNEPGTGDPLSEGDIDNFTEPGDITEPGYLEFLDRPRKDAAFNPNSLYTAFRTELVGVRSDKSEKQTGLYFTWISNLTTTGGGIVHSNLEDPEAGPPIAGGGIEDVQIFLPEPGDGGLGRIVGPAGFGGGRFVSGAEPLAYSTTFKNTALATDTTGRVVVTQPLDPDLDWATFEVGDFGFGGFLVDVPAGRQSYSTRVDATATRGVFVDVTAEVDLNGGQARWTFASIDPATGAPPTDASVGFLPPNTTSPEGEGFVNYSIRAKPGLPSSTTIVAQASLVFDTFAPISTPGFSNMIDTAPPTSEVGSLPATINSATISLTWTGRDEVGGSGIVGYDVFVSDNGGPYTLFRDNTTATSAVYRGRPGHQYSFYAIATDRVGRDQADFTTVTTTLGGAPAGIKHEFIDDDGDTYTLLLTGLGQMRFLPDDPDANETGPIGLVVLENTDPAKSKLSVKIKKGPTGDGRVSIGTIEGTGLKSISASASDLIGLGIDLTGPLSDLKLRDVLAGATIRATGTPAQGTTITAHAIEDGVTFHLGTTISSFTAAAMGAGSIDAPSIGNLTIKGDAKNKVGTTITPIPGNFNADLTLTGSDDPRKPITLGTVRVSGDVLDTEWTVTGDIKSITAKNWAGGSITAASLGTLSIKENFTGDVTLSGVGVPTGKPVLKSATVGRTVEGSTIRVGGTAGTFTAGEFVNSSLLVGYTPANPGDPFAGGTFAPAAKLANLRVLGIKGVADPAFENSVVAATSFGTISLKSIDGTNADTKFGLLADVGIDGLTVTTPGLKLKKVTATPDLDAAFGDFEVRVM